MLSMSIFPFPLASSGFVGDKSVGNVKQHLAGNSHDIRFDRHPSIQTVTARLRPHDESLWFGLLCRCLGLIVCHVEGLNCRIGLTNIQIAPAARHSRVPTFSKFTGTRNSRGGNRDAKVRDETKRINLKSTDHTPPQLSRCPFRSLMFQLTHIYFS